MFDIGWSEILLVAVLALVLLKPHEWPEAMRAMGRGVSKLKGVLADMQSQFNTLMHEAELDDVRQTLDDVRDLRSFSPLKSLAVRGDERAPLPLVSDKPAVSDTHDTPAG